MNREEFNKYCADVMGHELDYWNAECNGGLPSYKSKSSKRKLYNPYDDLNQMAEVVEKLAPLRHRHFISSLTGVWLGAEEPSTIKQAFRDFIISTKENL